jgi:hypothetical protein
MTNCEVMMNLAQRAVEIEFNGTVKEYGVLGVGMSFGVFRALVPEFHCVLNSLYYLLLGYIALAS